MASLQALSAAAQDRKARLAQLKSLKRKQPDSTDHEADLSANVATTTTAQENVDTSEDGNTNSGATTNKYLSGRNYDAETRNAKLGFEAAPSEGKNTLEAQAAALALEAKRQAAEEEQADKPLDLFKLQPKKPNWDLKRDLERKTEILNVRTDNAIARLVRDRIASQQKLARERAGGLNNGTPSTAEDSARNEAVGIEGTTLVEAANIREREDEEDARREREEEAALLDGS